MFFQALTSGILTGGLFALVAVGLTMILGVLKIINFAHGEFLMLGMYMTYWLCTLFNMDPYLTLIITIPAFFFFGVIIQRWLINPILDAPMEIQILLTLGLFIFLANLAQLLFGPHVRSIETAYTFKILTIGSVNFASTRLIMFIFAIIFTTALYIFLKKTDLGKAIRACSEESYGAMLVGINVKRVYMIAFGIGTACAAAAGSLAMPIYYVNPHIGATFVMTAFVVVVLGGMGNFMGALVGGFIIGLAESFGAVILSASLKQLVTFTIFVLILLLRPTGLFGTKRS
ncbi:MAG: branched-chain amino acid ABC transporter permease [Deltaproteobacteria bacterium]|nr:branched-chain amino acid ABC transporter permease [Deltaproteobacteria bacterium]